MSEDKRLSSDFITEGKAQGGRAGKAKEPGA